MGRRPQCATLSAIVDRWMGLHVPRYGCCEPALQMGTDQIMKQENQQVGLVHGLVHDSVLGICQSKTKRWNFFSLGTSFFFNKTDAHLPPSHCPSYSLPSPAASTATPSNATTVRRNGPVSLPGTRSAVSPHASAAQLIWAPAQRQAHMQKTVAGFLSRSLGAHT